VRAVRPAVGGDFPICLRYSQWKQQGYGAKLAQALEELARFLTPLVDAGVDLFHCRARRSWLPEFEGDSLNLAGWTKRLTGKATITVGSIALDAEFVTERSLADFNAASAVGIDELLARREREEFDVAALGRALIADAEWPRKVREGRSEEAKSFAKDLLARLDSRVKSFSCEVSADLAARARGHDALLSESITPGTNISLCIGHSPTYGWPQTTGSRRFRHSPCLHVRDLPKNATAM
jgi:2,4-dienoyl-CoA reductase-like NADH-dependent reductase (Old Yellow Enzyme family)